MRLYKHFLIGLLFCGQVFAQDIKIVGTVDATLKSPQTKNLNIQPIQQPIKLLKIELSEAAAELIKNRAVAKNTKLFAQMHTNSLPSAIQLGMNNVPVLNQGANGSCVTFANTGALDAAIGKGDYISQLCQLQLGLYLQQFGYNPSGWNGADGRSVLNQINAFGIINKDNQRTYGCGGMTEYPMMETPGPEHAMTPEQFHQISEDLVVNDSTSWSTILDMYDGLVDRTDTNETIQKIKVALNAKERVTFGVLLLDFDLGFMGAVGTHASTFDTWVLTPEIARDIFLRPFFGGRERIITGYDDDAVAIDEKGREHKGLFTLRNSWGEKFGNRGDFYMSYDYFKVLVIEAQRIRNLSIMQGAKR